MVRKIITSNLIESILLGNDRSYIVNNGRNNQLLIRDCEFGYFSSSESLEIPYNIVFENCSFMQPFYLQGVIKGNIDFRDCNYNEQLTFKIMCSELKFELCYGDGIAFIDGCEIQKVICNSRKTSWIRIEGGKITILEFFGIYGSIMINMSGFNYNLLIKNITVTASIIFENGNFNNLCIEQGNIHNLHIQGGVFDKGIRINEVTFEKDFHIMNGNFKDDFKLYKCVSKSDIKFEGGIFNNLNIEQGNFNDFYIKGGVFNKSIVINGEIFEKDFHIINGDFKENFKIYQGVFKNNIQFEGGRFEKNISIVKADIRYLKFENIEKLNRFLTYKDVFIDTFSFSATKGNYNLFISDTIFNKIEFLKANSLKDNFFQFNQIKVHELNFERFSNLGISILLILSQKSNIY